jgi:uncharacterized membrane protein YfcA
MEILGYFAAIVVGMVLGALGGGGSILSIPILVYLFGIEPVLASAYSLFIVGTTSFVGAIPKYREHLVNLRTGILFGIPSIVVIFSTRKWVVPALPEIIFQTESFTLTKRAMLLGLFGILMVLASFSMIKNRKEPEAKHTPLPHISGNCSRYSDRFFNRAGWCRWRISDYSRPYVFNRPEF